MSQNIKLWWSIIWSWRNKKPAVILAGGIKANCCTVSRLIWDGSVPSSNINERNKNESLGGVYCI